MRKLIILLLVFSFQFPTYSTFACSCIEPKYPLEAVDDANVVFIWKVNSIETISETIWTFPNQFETYNNKVNFQINTMIKWDLTDTIQITTPKDSATCWFNFEEWKDYIVYTYLNTETNELSVSLCSRTGLLKNASEDLAVLNIKNIPTSNNSDVNISVSTDKISDDITPKVDKTSNKNIYIWIFIWVLALALIVSCAINMNKKK